MRLHSGNLVWSHQQFRDVAWNRYVEHRCQALRSAAADYFESQLQLLETNAKGNTTAAINMVPLERISYELPWLALQVRAIRFSFSWLCASYMASFHLSPYLSCPCYT